MKKILELGKQQLQGNADLSRLHREVSGKVIQVDKTEMTSFWSGGGKAYCGSQKGYVGHERLRLLE